MATLITKNSSTASAVPAAGDLVKGELAVNVTDKKLYTKDNGGSVVKVVGGLGNQEANAVAITGGAINGTTIGATTASTGAFTTVSASSGFTGNLTGNVTGNVSGTAANVTGIVAIANGGTGLSALGTGVQTALGQNVTGSGSFVLSTSPSLTTPNLGTPSAAVLTNATGLPLTTGVTGTLGVANGGTGITAFGTGVATALGQNVTGSGGIVLAASPSLTTPNLGTPSAATLTNATGLPISTGVSGLGTGVATALAVNTGFAGAFVVNGGALGTPSSGTLTNATGLPLSTGVTGTLATTNGGTGLTSFTANGVVYASSTSALTTGSALTFDGTNFATTGTASATKFIATGGTATGNGMYLPAANTLAFSTNGAERIRVDSSGLVGIGTSSPSRQLDVSGAGQNIARFTSSGASTSLGLDNTNANAWGSNISFATGGTISGYFGTIGGILGNTTQDLAAYANTGNGFRVYTNGNNLRASIDSSGNFTLNTGTFTYSAGTANGVAYLNGSKVLTTGSALTFDGTNLGVGVASPTLRIQATVSGATTTFDGLQVANGTATFRLGTTGATYSYAGVGANEVWLYAAGSTPLSIGPDGNAPIKFVSNGSERARITSGGDLLVGTTSALSSVSGSSQVKIGEAGIQTTSQAISANTATTIARSGSGGVAIVAGYNGTGQYSAIVLFKYGGTATSVVGVLNDTGSTITYSISGVNLQITSSLALTNVTVTCIRSA